MPRPADLPTPPDSPASVTVVIPVRNGAATIGEQLRRLAAEPLTMPWTIVVADNGSTDDTSAVVESERRRFPPITVVDASAKRGPAYARNTGAAAATGALLCFCDADDEIEPGWLAAIVAGAGGHHFTAGRLDVDTINAATTRGWRPRPLTAGTDRPPFAPSGNMAVWADVFAAVGGFDEEFLANEDADLTARLLAAGAHMGWAPDAVVHYRFRDSSGAVTRQSFRSAWFAVVARRRAGERLGPSSSTVARAILWLVVRLPYIAIAARRGLWLHRLGALGGEVGAAVWLGGTDRWVRRREGPHARSRGDEHR